MMKLSAKQTDALAMLRVMRDTGRLVVFTRNGVDLISTGINTLTLASLRTKGWISVSRIGLGGIVSADLVVR